MNTRPSFLCATLIASLGISGAAPAIAGSPVSAIPVDAAALSAQICDENPSKAGGSMLECHVKVKHVKIGRKMATEAASALQLVSADPLVTPCGLWDATLTLDPIRLQTPEDPESDAFAIGLKMSTHLRLANRETGQTAAFALHRGPGMKDSWVLAPAGAPLNLFLTGSDKSDDEIITFEGCIPRWVYKDPDLEVIVEDGCEACPEDDQTGD